MSDVKAIVVLTEPNGLARPQEYLRVGVPLARGEAFDVEALELADAAGNILPAQFRALASWPDRSIKWVLLDGVCALEANQRCELTVRAGGGGRSAVAGAAQVDQGERGIRVDTGAACFHLRLDSATPFDGVRVGDNELVAQSGCDLTLLDEQGAPYAVRVDRKFVEESGPVRVAVVAEGAFVTGPRTLKFETRAVFHAGSAAVRFEVKLLNPHVAHHRGGLWDLGDPGSYVFRDLSLKIRPAGQATRMSWYVTPDKPHTSRSPAEDWVLLQDSSGGEHWDSDNHVDRSGASTVSFRGFQARTGEKIVEQGNRATPCLGIGIEHGWLAASVEDFWQNFPKALRWQQGALQVSLFPAETKSAFELQGGEQKRHTVLLDFGLEGTDSVLPRLQQPAIVHVAASSVEESRAVQHFVAALDASSADCGRYVDNIIDGKDSFFAKREIIDEYGWRNFGDLYADHEAVKHQGPRPLVSHYNNQYDFIYGAFQNFQRTGDARWWRLMRDAARHTIDIDVYHTKEDRAAFNGGLFWHTDHYKPALTCSHRTYSAANAAGGDYGGGPSNEHNYTSGLLHYYYLTGDDEARQTVVGLAEWVIAMDDGKSSLLALVDEEPTGLASKTVSPDFHKAGRGAGNSINALLDAYALSRDRRYVRKAEELIQRCIHPADDIDALGLLEPEYRWSYLVFLQVLGKYLDQKREWGELDYDFYFARDGLLHYARWVARNEVPYKDVLHKVEIPTETWPAHDVRKSHLLYVAAKYAPESERAELRTRARFFFERCIADVTSFATANLTRPLVILSVYGSVHAYYQRHANDGVPYVAHNYSFGDPTVFVPQRGRLRSVLSRKRQVVIGELRRIVRDKLRGVLGR
ncbi:MAG: hypothetical protein WDO68_20630 [Gammaproteobacteria bacterium]